MERLRVARTAWSALAVLLALGLILVPATAAPAAPRQAASADRLLLDAAGWHGRAVQRPHDHTAVRTSSASPPSGWSAGAVALGAGLTRPDGSRRVREVQRRLRRLGYATGPVDGIYGRRTRAAVAWFQHKHGLPRTGRASVNTVRHLRTRTGAPASAPGPDTRRGEAPPAPAPADSSAATVAPRVTETPSARDDRIPWEIVAALALAGTALLAIGTAIQRRGRRPRRAAAAPAPSPRPVRSAVPDRSGRPRAFGYIRLARGAPSASFHAQAAAIETGCLSRGITLVSLVSDLEPERGAAGRPPALAFALERLGSGDADRLVVSRLDHLAPTREELAPMLESLAARDVGLVVLDRDVDTAALPDPTVAAAVLDRDAGPPPTALDPGAAPAVDAHIASMLGEGASPEEVAAALNTEPVPPPEGGRWSRDGVEAAGRRRWDPMERTNA